MKKIITFTLIILVILIGTFLIYKYFPQKQLPEICMQKEKIENPTCMQMQHAVIYDQKQKVGATPDM